MGRVKKSIAGWVGRKPAVSAIVNRDKLDLIDHVFKRCATRPRSFVDLGGVWNVDGAYTFHALKNHRVDRAVLVDGEFSRETLSAAASFPQLSCRQGYFGDPEVVAEVGQVEVALMFDILLHQVKPDWQEVLAMYAPAVNYFVIYNQQWVGSETSVRFLELGEEEYFRNVPHDRSHPLYSDLFQKLDDRHPAHGRLWRDIYNIWQWGISDADLLAEMKQLGFSLQYYKNVGQYGNLPNIENHAFIFAGNFAK